MSRVCVFVVPRGNGWQVGARGMVWDQESRQGALAFAESLASRYAQATRSSAVVRVREESGMQLVARFGDEHDAMSA